MKLSVWFLWAWGLSRNGVKNYSKGPLICGQCLGHGLFPLSVLAHTLSLARYLSTASFTTHSRGTKQATMDNGQGRTGQGSAALARSDRIP